MATQILPQVRVFQQFTALPLELVEPLRAFIFGPEYDLHRYGETGESDTKFADYDASAGHTINWLTDLGRRTGAIVDQSYTKVYMEDAWLRYFDHGPNTGEENQTSPYTAEGSAAVEFRAVQGKPTQIQTTGTTAVNLAAKTGFSLYSDFYDRDVAVGDGAWISGTIDGTTYSTYATITAVSAVATASTVGTPAADAGNTGALTATVPATATADAGSGHETINTAGAYDGLASGVMTETYTIAVVTPTVGDDVSTGVLSVTSSSGTDDVASVVPDGSDGTFNVGTRGVTATWDTGDGSGTYAVGQTWTLAVIDGHVVASPSTSGTYGLETDTTYIVEVVRGGTWTDSTAANRPQVRVTTTNGVDGVATYTVAATADNDPIDIALGNSSVTFSLEEDTNEQLVTGDKWTIACTAAGEGAIRVLTLDTELPTQLQKPTSSASPDLSVRLYIKQDSIQVNSRIENSAFNNWSQTATALTIAAAAKEYDDSWRGGEFALNIDLGEVFIEWRELVTDNATSIQAITSTSDITDIFDTF